MHDVSRTNEEKRKNKKIALTRWVLLNRGSAVAWPRRRSYPRYELVHLVRNSLASCHGRTTKPARESLPPLASVLPHPAPQCQVVDPRLIRQPVLRSFSPQSCMVLFHVSLLPRIARHQILSAPRGYPVNVNRVCQYVIACLDILVGHDTVALPVLVRSETPTPSPSTSSG